MEVLKYIVIGIYVIVCLALIVVAMMQSKDDAGMSGAMTGSSSNNFYEKNKGRTREGKLKMDNNFRSSFRSINNNTFNYVCNLVLSK